MTAERIANAKAFTLQESTRQFKQVYMQRGFNNTNILMDGKFNCIRGNLAEPKKSQHLLKRRTRRGDRAT